MTAPTCKRRFDELGFDDVALVVGKPPSLNPDPVVRTRVHVAEVEPTLDSKNHEPRRENT